MALTPGTRLGVYEVTAQLGEGGMGEVYKGRDTRLDRTVAIKILHESLSSDPQFRERFDREARAVAALDHPHICGIYDVGDANGTHFIVMPYLEGETLAERLARKAGSKDLALRIEEALKIATEIADALDKAHRQGIVHRDLKPANIMLTKTGSKLLDFGLAKFKAPTGPISMSGMTRLATSAPATAQGTILGTVQYMAPEQVEGKEADARSDIWALGAVFYEMATGTRPFTGDTPASIIGAILRDDPPALSVRQPQAPRVLDHLVGVCLAKDPELRWQSVADVRRALEWIGQNSREIVERPTTTQSRWFSSAGWIVAVILLVVLGVNVIRSRFLETPQAPPEPIAFSVYPPPGRVFSGPPASVPVPQLALSPDGRHLAFVAAEPQGQSFLWLRTLADAESRRLPGTEDAETPFWAPDSRAVAFFSQGLMKKRDLSGTAPPEVIAPVTVDMRGGAWSPSGAILYAPSGNIGLHTVAPGGGAGSLLKLNQGSSEFSTARWPTFLPDGRHFLFQVRDPDPERKGIYLGSLDSSSTNRLTASDWSTQYTLGYLMFLNGPMLMAQPFDLDTHVAMGTPTAIAQPVAGGSGGYGAFSVSQTGVLAYSSGFVVRSDLRWVDRTGRPLTTVAPTADYVDFRLSPDDSRLAFSRTDPLSQAPDVWVLDLARGTSSRLTSSPLTDAAPVWSPAGDQIIYRSNAASGSLELFRTLPSPGANVDLIFGQKEQRAAHGSRNVLSTDWSLDGKFVIYHGTTGATGYDLWALPVEGERKPISIARAQYNEVQGAVSPNTRWIAYASDESGKYEIYVQSFPDPNVAPKTTVSTAGGIQPRWSKDGRELFYLRSDGMLMAVAVRMGPAFQLGAVTPLFKTSLPTGMNAYRMDYVPAGDGRRFLMKVPIEGTTPPSITVVLNWTAGLRK